MTVMELMDLPAVGNLSEEQTRGVACVWCAAALSTDTAVDLGERRVWLLNGLIVMFPRACPPCVAKYAHRALHRHAPTCEPCVDNADRCDTGRALYRLIRENRR